MPPPPHLWPPHPPSADMPQFLLPLQLVGVKDRLVNIHNDRLKWVACEHSLKSPLPTKLILRWRRLTTHRRRHCARQRQRLPSTLFWCQFNVVSSRQGLLSGCHATINTVKCLGSEKQPPAQVSVILNILALRDFICCKSIKLNNWGWMSCFHWQRKGDASSWATLTIRT